MLVPATWLPTSVPNARALAVLGAQVRVMMVAGSPGGLYLFLKSSPSLLLLTVRVSVGLKAHSSHPQVGFKYFLAEAIYFVPTLPHPCSNGLDHPRWFPLLAHFPPLALWKLPLPPSSRRDLLAFQGS